jgi:hypothetical protein
MSDLEFLPAWYPRMLRRRRLAIAATVVLLVALITLAVTFAL